MRRLLLFLLWMLCGQLAMGQEGDSGIVLNYNANYEIQPPQVNFSFDSNFNLNTEWVGIEPDYELNSSYNNRENSNTGTYDFSIKFSNSNPYESSMSLAEIEKAYAEGVRNSDAGRAFAGLYFLLPSRDEKNDFFGEEESDGLSARGLEFREDFCKQARHRSSDLMSGHDALPNSVSEAKRMSSIVLGYSSMWADHDLLYKLSGASKDLYSNFCAGLEEAECAKKVQDPKQDFQTACEEAFMARFAPPHLDLKGNYGTSFLNALNSSGVKARAPWESEETDCADGRNCYFFKSDNTVESCNPFSCSMTDGDSFDSQTMEWAQPFILSANNQNFSSSDPSRCDECFRKQFQRIASSAKQRSFDEEKEKSREKLKDALAAGEASKAFFGLAAGIENLFDIGVLHPEALESVNPASLCAEDLDATITTLTQNGCGNSVGAEKAKGRLRMALKAAGMTETALTSPGSIPSALLGKVNPASSNTPRNACSREDFVKAAAIQWGNLKNIDYVQGFEAIINERAFLSEIDQVCSNVDEKAPQVLPSQLYAEASAKRYWEQVSSQVRQAYRDGGADAAIEAFCVEPESSSSAAINKVACGEENALWEAMARFDGRRIKESLEQGQLDAESLEAVFREGLQARIKTSLEVPMSLNPSLRMAMSDWGSLCSVRSTSRGSRILLGGPGTWLGGNSNLEFSDYLQSVSVGTESFRDIISAYAGNLCQKTTEKMQKTICDETGAIPGEKSGEKSAFSPADLEKARSLIAEEEKERDPVESLVFNGLSCELNSMAQTRPDFFSSEAKTLASLGNEASSYEQMIALGESQKFDQGLRALGGMSFQNWDGCTEESVAYNNWALNTRAGLGGAQMGAAAARRNREQANRQTEAANKRQMIITGVDESGGLVRVTSSNDELGIPSGIRDSKGGSIFSPRSIASSREQALSSSLSTDKRIAGHEGVSSRPAASERTESYRQEEGADSDRLGSFTQIGRAIASVQPAQTPNATRVPTSVNSSFSCDVECLKRLRHQAARGRDTAELAEEAGIPNYAAASKGIKTIFEETLKGAREDASIEKLKSENLQLRETMRQIRDQLDKEEKQTRVLSSDGTDLSGAFQTPSASERLVYNPRNTEVNEFRSANHFERRIEEFSPNFQNSAASAPERISLGEYSSERRAAASLTPVDEVPSFNQELDKSFLKIHQSDAVDNAYIAMYVDHINKNSGSIEHLVVFEDGAPVGIRVPDPQNPGAYVEKPLSEDLAELVIQNVERDEARSYAIYNMVAFGQSLEQFMLAVEQERADIATLESLNKNLNSILAENSNLP